MLSGWYVKLYPEQKPAADFLISCLTFEGGAALLSEQGTGKTIITLAVLEKLGLRNILIVTPKTSVHVTWANRIPNACTVIGEYVSGVLIIGYEAFRTRIKKLLKKKWDIVVFDESQGLKSRNSSQSKAARRLRNVVPMRLILSGTPIDESPIDMWAQMRFIKPEVFGDVWAAPRKPKPGQRGPYFETEFCRPCGFMGKQREFIPERMPEFLRRLKPYVYRLQNTMEAVEFVEVPTLLLGSQRRIYDQMERHGIVKIEGEKFKAGMRAVRDVRCFQIVGGFLSNDETTVKVGNAKQRKLRTLIKRLDRPVIFCRYLSEVNEVKSILEEEFKRVAIITGKVKDTPKEKRRTRIIEDFQSRKYDALVCQERTGGVSIELTASNELVLYSMGFSRINFEQIIARFRRHGQTKRVRVFLIIAKDTVDEEPLAAIRRKGETVNPIMDFLNQNPKEITMSDEKKKAAPKKAAAKKTAPKKAAAKKTAPKKAAKAATEEFAFGVDYVAEKLGVSVFTARGKLRAAEIKKAGKSYGWKTKGEADKAINSLTA